MKYRFYQDAIVYSKRDTKAPVVVELHAGETHDLTTGELIKAEGVDWTTVTLSDGRTGYAQAGAKVHPVGPVILAQPSAEVLETPLSGSKIKSTLKRGDRFTVVGYVEKEGMGWVEVETNPGDVGYLSVSTDIVWGDGPQAAQMAKGSGLGSFAVIVIAGLSFFFLRDLFSGKETPVFLVIVLVIAVGGVLLFAKVFRKN